MLLGAESVIPLFPEEPSRRKAVHLCGLTRGFCIDKTNEMEMNMLLVALVAAVVLMTLLGFLAGRKLAAPGGQEELRKKQEDEMQKTKQLLSVREQRIQEMTEEVKTLTAEREVQRNRADNAERLIMQEQKRNEQLKRESQESLQCQMEEWKRAYENQLAEVRLNAERQIAALKEMNQQQVKSQADVIREQMKATSEQILKEREQELALKNREQVSLIIDPLNRSLKEMREALDKNKEQQNQALNRLDATIQANMQQSSALGETADRLTRALTGEVKVQGNFGELKLRQLLEDMELHEGEQFDTQETLRDRFGKALKDDEGKGLIPDFILHFPNNRHVVVDSKMSLTDYERYMNAESPEERTAFLRAHIDSVRAQVTRLARKDYSKYLPAGYNKLNFVIMYVPIESALSLALLNDATLWHDAYNQGVMILGPQSMYMNLRVLEMMWTQVRQLQNQQEMMDAANIVIERIQDFGMRFLEVESALDDTRNKMQKLRTTTASDGRSIITAAKNLLKAGARENKKKKGVTEMEGTVFLEADSQPQKSLQQPQDE